MQIQIQVWTVLTLLVVGLVGCDKKADGPAAPPAQPGSSGIGTATPVLQSILTVWQNGEHATAISNFVQADWTSRPLFPVGSSLNLTEDEFRSQVRSMFSADAVNAMGTNLMAELEPIKRLAAAVGQAGQKAAVEQDYPTARKHFTALKQCGEALDGTNSLGLLKLVGQGLRKRAEIELSKLPQ
jgi:hypothetical protein